MRSIAHTGFSSRPSSRGERGDLHGAFVRRFRRLASAVSVALKVRSERRMLLSLDDRALKDVGFSHSEASTEASRSFWDIPVDRLRL
jgi:uncharacterized protein YjiS (DUF1127 family)